MRIIKTAKLFHNGIGVSPKVLYAMHVADELHWENTTFESTWTSLLDGRHMVHSRHYSGLAADMRTWALVWPQEFATNLALTLGDEFDVIFEGDHLHLEFDPER